jgi:hypothetical protein
MKNPDSESEILFMLPADPFKAVCTIEQQVADFVAFFDRVPGDQGAESFNLARDLAERVERVKRELQRRRNQP